MANNEISILIKAWLDQSNESVKDLNAQIKELQKKVQALDIKINIDQEALSGLENLIKIYNDNASRINKDLNQVIKENIKIIKEANGVVKKYIEQHLKSGEIIHKEITEIDKKNEALERQSIALEEIISQEHKLIKARTRYNADGTISGRTEIYRKGLLDTVVNFDENGNIKSFYEAENLAKEKLRKQLIDLALTGKYTTEELRKVGKALTFAETTDEINRVQLKLDNLKLSVRKLSQEPATINIKGEQFGQLDSLINTRLTREHVKDIINLSDAYRNLKIIESSVDQTTGKWTATLRLNSKEQLVLKGQVDAATGSIYKQGEAIKQASAKNLGMFQQLAIAMKRIPVWMLGMFSFYFPIRQFQQGLQYIHELDTAMTNLRKVTDETSESYRKFEIEANKIANTLATTTIDVINSTTEWARLGYSLKQATALAKEAIIYANVGDMGIEEANQALISAIKGFGIQVDEEGRNVRKIVDLYNEVGNKYAISSEGIGSALQRSASSLASAGNTIEESVALITAANTVIQNPERVGNGLKTVAMRIRGISEEGEDLTNLVPTLEKQFNALGLTLKKDDNTFKSTYEIFKDLSSVWNDITDFQRANILELVAGKHQGNVIDSLIRNFKDAENALVTGLNSAGSATKEYENYLNSIDAKLATLKNTAIGFWQTSLNTEGIKDLIESATHLVDILTKVVDTIGFIPPILGIVGGSSVLLSKSFRTAVLTTSSWSAALKGLTISAKAAKVAIQGLIASTLVGAAFMAIGWVFEQIGNSIFKAKKEAEEFKKTQQTLVEAVTTHKDNLNELISKYEEYSTQLENGTKLDNNQEQEYLDIQQKIAELLPTAVKLIDSKGQAHLKNAQSIKEELRYAQQLADLEESKKITSAKDDINDLINQRRLIETQIRNAQWELEHGRTIGRNSQKLSDIELKSLEIQLLGLQRRLADINNESSDLVTSITESILKLNNISINDNITKFFNDLYQSVDFSKLNTDQSLAAINDLANGFVKLTNAKTIAGATEAFNELKTAIKTLKPEFTDDDIQEFINSLNNINDVVEDAQNTVFDLSKFQSELNKSLGEYVDSVKDLSSAYESLNDDQDLSLEQIISLIGKYPELANSLRVENGLLKLNKDAVETLMKAKEAEFKASLWQRKEELRVQKETMESKLAIYSGEIEALQKLDEARYLSNAKTLGEAQLLKENFDKYKSLIDQINGINVLINSDLTKNLSGRSKSSSSKDNPQLKELEDSTDAFIRLQNAAANANKELANRIKDQIEMAKNQENYNDAISKTNDLLKTQRQIVDDLKYANQNINAQADKLRKNNSQYDTSKWFDRNAEATIAYYNQLNSLIEKRNRIEQSVKDKDSRAKQVEAIDKEINSIKQLFDQLQKLKKAYMDNVVSIHEMNSAIREINSSLSQLQYDQIIYTLDYYADKMEEVDRLMSISQASMEQYNETSSEYAKEMANLSSLLAYKKSLIKDEIDLIKEQLTSNDLLITQQEELKKRLQELELAYLQLNRQQEENVKKVADNLINVYKDALKKQMDLLVATKNKEIKFEDERHKQVMDNLDDELKKYEEIIQAKLRSLEDQWSEEDFNKELAKMQGEAQDIQNKINELSLDDSIEAKVQREELERQLQAKLLEIEDFKTKRSRDLRKQALQDQLDNFKKEIDAKKKAEDEQYNATKARLEKEREDIQWHYNELLKNEREFERLRTDIINGHVDEIQNKLTAFITEFKKINEQAAYDIGESYQELLNIIDRVNSATGAMSTISIPSSTPSVPSQNNLKVQAWNEYLENKRKAEQLYKEKGYWDTALNARNNELRQQWGFPDGSYEKLKNLKMYHQGGIVGDNGSPVAKWINKMFNLKPNEEIIKALKGEVVVNPMKFERLMPKLTLPKIPNQVANSTSSPTVIHIDKFMPIDKVDRNTDVRKLFNDAENELKNWGIIIPTSS